jgi:hypothetical protein
MVFTMIFTMHHQVEIRDAVHRGATHCDSILRALGDISRQLQRSSSGEAT